MSAKLDKIMGGRGGGKELIAIGYTHSLVLNAEDAEDKQRQTSLGRADWPL